jgi:hypothetical protein
LLLFAYFVSCSSENIFNFNTNSWTKEQVNTFDIQMETNQFLQQYNGVAPNAKLAVFEFNDDTIQNSNAHAHLNASVVNVEIQ